MTLLTKVIRRETYTFIREAGRDRALVVMLTPSTVCLKDKGLRKWYTIDLMSVYSLAVKAQAIENQKEKRRQRELKRKGLA